MRRRGEVGFTSSASGVADLSRMPHTQCHESRPPGCPTRRMSRRRGDSLTRTRACRPQTEFDADHVFVSVFRMNTQAIGRPDVRKVSPRTLAKTPPDAESSLQSLWRQKISEERYEYS